MGQQKLQGSLLHVQTPDGIEGVVFASSGQKTLVAYIDQLREGSSFQTWELSELKVLGRKTMNHKLWYGKLPTPMR